MPYGLLIAHICYLRCQRRKFEQKNVVFLVPLLMSRWWWERPVPQSFAQCLPCHPQRHLCAPPRCLFWFTLPRAPHGTYFSRDRGCSLPVTRNRACGPQLYPSSSMGTQVVLPFLPLSCSAELCVPLPCSPAQSFPHLQDVQSRPSESSMSLWPACHCHQTASFVPPLCPLLLCYVGTACGAELVACTERGSRVLAGQGCVRTCTLGVKWHPNCL